MSFDENKQLFKALSNETSYNILKLLSQKEKCACEIPMLIKRTQSNTSMHLKKLCEQDLLKRKRQGKKIIYSIKDKEIIKKLKTLKVI